MWVKEGNQKIREKRVFGEMKREKMEKMGERNG